MKQQTRRDFLCGMAALVPVLFVGLLIKRLRKRRQGEEPTSESSETANARRRECPYCGGVSRA